MTAISAVLVKELREKTGAGMMECKKALEAAKGNLDGAIEELRKSGLAKAAKRADRVATEGRIVTLVDEAWKLAMMLEVNSETDFVSRDESFVAYAKAVAETAWEAKVKDLAALLSHSLKGFPGQTVEDARQALITKVGENVMVRRLMFSAPLANPAAQTVGIYRHGDRIGVIVELDIANKDLAKDIAMHIAASRPMVVMPEHLSSELLEKEKEIYSAQAATSGKPKEIIEKMVQGKLKNFLNEVSLVGQPFVKDPTQTVGELLTKNKAKVLAFYRFEVGEAQAVVSQAQGN